MTDTNTTTTGSALKARAGRNSMGAMKSNAVDAGGSNPDDPRGVNYAYFNGNTGAFTFGRDKHPIPEDQEFAIHHEGLKHGWLFWEDGKAEKATEVNISAKMPAPAKPDDRPLTGSRPRPHDRDGWSRTVTIEFKGIGGALANVTLSITHSSVALTRAWGDICKAIADRFDADPDTPYLNPVVVFEHSSYEHPDYNRDVYVVQPKVLAWMDDEGNRVEHEHVLLPDNSGSSDLFDDPSEDEEDVLA